MNKEQLHQLYIIEKQSLRTIASKLGVSAPTVRNYLKKFGLKTRNVSEALTGRKLSEEHNRNKTKAQTGSGNPFYGKKHSKESRQKMSEKLSGENHPNYGKNLSKETRNRIRQKHIGKKMSAESRKKMSETRKDNPKYSGENHPLYGTKRLDMKGENHHRWNGGVTPLYKQIRETREYKNWRQACFERDNYTCQFCGQHGGELHVDHIKTYSGIINKNSLTNVEKAIKCKDLWDISNGRTLCVICHRKTPTYGGSSKLKKLKECVEREG